ncbi:hypothetical protein D9M68_472380 [compost metagenome]
MVAAGLQVVEHVQRGPGGRQVVVVLQVGHRYAPQLATAVVLVDHRGLPAVLVEVQGALGVDVAGARLQGAFHDPHAVQFVAGDGRVQVARLQQVVVFDLGAGHLVVVVGNVDFLLAHQLPVVAVRRTVEHVGVIGGTQAVGGGDRRVVGEVRRAAHATLAGVVAPGLARFLDLVQGLVDQGRTTGQACRALGEGQVEEEDVVQVGVRPFRVVVLEQGFLLRGHQGVVAIALHGHFRGAADDVAAAVADDVVPQGFHAVLRNRERDAAVGVGEAVAAVQQLGAGGVLDGVVIDPLRRGAGAAGLVDRHLEAVRVGIEQGDLTRGQVGLVLVQVGLGDGEQRLVFRERVRMVLAGLVAGRSLGDAAGPGRDGAGGVAALLGAEGGQAAAELGGILGRDLRQGAAGGQRQGNRGAYQRKLFQHVGSP